MSVPIVKVFGLAALEIICAQAGEISQSPSSPSTGLVAYYPFNANAKDQSGNGNDGAVHGASLTEDRFGTPNAAYAFDGSSTYIEMSKSLPDATSMSFSVWITSPIAGFNQAVFVEGDHTPGFDFALSFNSAAFNDGPTLIFPTKDDSTLSYVFGQRDTTRWVHIVGVADAARRRKEIWINSLLVSSSTFGGLANIGHHYKLQIGRGADGVQTGQYFKGKIDDLRIYNRALTAADIEALELELRIKPTLIADQSPLPAITLLFDTAAGKAYTVQSTVDLSVWADRVTVTGDGREASISFTDQTKQFFRLLTK